MRTLILADIHSNIDALDAVLMATGGLRIHRVLVLGDIVGYNASPREVLRRLDTLSPVATVRGNHDKACAGLASTALFHPVARHAIEWTQRQLSPELLAGLAALPAGPLRLNDDIELCHGSPFDEDYYVVDVEDAALALAAATTRVCLNAHTHVPAVFCGTGDWALDQTPPHGSVSIVEWPTTDRLLVNVGSVGQPRDGDPRAAFGVLDEGAATLELRRVDYPVATAQRRILDAGLPSVLAERLELGY